MKIKLPPKVGQWFTESNSSLGNSSLKTRCLHAMHYVYMSETIFVVSCNTSAVNSNTKLSLNGFTYSLTINCTSDYANDDLFLPSRLHDDFFQGTNIPVSIQIYGCFITSISNVFRKPLSYLTIQGGFNNRHDLICKHENEIGNETKQTVCANDNLIFSSGMFSGVKLEILDMTGLRLNDSIWQELREMPVKRLRVYLSSLNCELQNYWLHLYLGFDVFLSFTAFTLTSEIFNTVSTSPWIMGGTESQSKSAEVICKHEKIKLFGTYMYSKTYMYSNTKRYSTVCQTNVLNTESKITNKNKYTFVLKFICTGDRSGTSRLSDDIFKGYEYLQILDIYGCVLAQIHGNALPNDLAMLRIQTGYNHEQRMTCKDAQLDEKINKLGGTVGNACEHYYLWYPPGIFSRLPLKHLELNGLQVNDSIWAELERLARKRDLKNLKFENNNIRAIKPESLNKLYKLRYLDLHNNEIQTISAGTFSTLNHLIYIDLSENKIRYVDGAAFSNGLSRLLYLNMTSNNISEIHAGTFKLLRQLKELNISSNQIQAIEKVTFDGLEHLETLDLRFNKIKIIARDHFQFSTALKYLDIRNNPLSFKSLSVHIFIAISKHFTVNMSQNHWTCDCESLENIKQFMYENTTYTNYFRNLSCDFTDRSNNQSTAYKLSEVFMPQTCRNISSFIVYQVLQNNSSTINKTASKTSQIYNTEAIIVISVILSVAIVAFVIVGLVFKFRKFLKIWCFIKFGWKFNRDDDANDADRPYDAFVSYNSNDVDIVIREILPRLEEPRNGRQGYKLCIHQRDFPVGGVIAETIIDAVNKSKRVIMLLSNNFLRSEWCQYEFQKAHYQLLKERKNRIIMILLEEIDPELLYKEMGLYLKTRTYVTYNDPWLWPKIEYAMPDARPINEGNLIGNGELNGQLDIAINECYTDEDASVVGNETTQLD